MTAFFFSFALFWLRLSAGLSYNNFNYVEGKPFCTLKYEGNCRQFLQEKSNRCLLRHAF